MKPVIVLASAVAVAALAGPALAKDPNVEIRHAVARVAVVVEDRADIAVEVEQGASGLPPIRVTREGDETRIDGGLRRRGWFGSSDGVRECRSGSADAARPGDGASVEVRGHGRVELADAPLIVIRTPRNVDVSAGGAVFGSIGRGASAISLGAAGCGDWAVANVEGPLDVSIAGSGDVRAGTSRSLDVAIAGSGSLSAGATGGLDVSIAGSGDVAVARVEGPVDAAIVGSGDVLVRGGSVTTIDASIAGSGDVVVQAPAGSVDASIMGSGDVRVASVSGTVERSVAGSGSVIVGE